MDVDVSLPSANHERVVSAASPPTQQKTQERPTLCFVDEKNGAAKCERPAYFSQPFRRANLITTSSPEGRSRLW
jgi:hypothetical protein